MRIRKSECLVLLYMVLLLPMAIFIFLELKYGNETWHNADCAEAADQTEERASDETAAERLNVSVIGNDGQRREMNLDSYLISVLLCELPASFSDEAIKAQAVVARTYTLRQQEIGTKHLTADVCADPGCCQGFIAPNDYIAEGGSETFVARVSDAVLETDPMVLQYNGAIIEATYFSCSGGKTEDAVAVWGTEIPYLKSAESPGEEISENFVRTVTFSSDQFRELLSLEENVSLIPKNVVYTSGNGVATAEIGGTIYKGTELRKLLGLRSTCFAMTMVGNNVVITTKGYGHRVGMSQYGAEAMARQGASFEEILKHYYQGAELADYNGYRLTTSLN